MHKQLDKIHSTINKMSREDLVIFCYDYCFDVYEQFTPQTTRQEMVELLFNRIEGILFEGDKFIQLLTTTEITTNNDYQIENNEIKQLYGCFVLLVFVFFMFICSSVGNSYDRNLEIQNELKATLAKCRPNCQGVNLSSIELSGEVLNKVDFSRANLSGADLSHANLQRAILEGANLKGANLSHTNLVKVNLHEAYLHNADLVYARLQSAILTSVDLSGARLIGANLEGVIYNEDTIWPSETVPEGTIKQ